ncbi:hypothetical protein [Roseomonas genomospecies 6]|uniref:Uncharacterized protein n=1 Tax=Roseomonas genomospecies 6 TaxID=214106 RepID=A0A9W7KQM2_9PROT|nr:hypothetical protein [Roseomonas genomospecies 6]KAA0677608.1 hypothetical protein DS843_22475 [Roseomonas genomospecies 6]
MKMSAAPTRSAAPQIDRATAAVTEWISRKALFDKGLLTRFEMRVADRKWVEAGAPKGPRPTTTIGAVQAKVNEIVRSLGDKGQRVAVEFWAAHALSTAGKLLDIDGIPFAREFSRAGKPKLVQGPEAHARVKTKAAEILGEVNRRRPTIETIRKAPVTGLSRVLSDQDQEAWETRLACVQWNLHCARVDRDDAAVADWGDALDLVIDVGGRAGAWPAVKRQPVASNEQVATRQRELVAA